MATVDFAHAPSWLAVELHGRTHGAAGPRDRMVRFRALFAGELTAVDEALTSSKQRPLDDDSLRAALYLARRLPGMLLDCQPGEVNRRLPTDPG
jgi:hypothetical protein